MEIRGKLHEIGVSVQVTDSLKKREFILEYIENPQYPEYLKFELINEKVNLLNDLKAGQTVEVYFNLRGRPFTDKSGKKGYFNSMLCWRIKPDLSQVDNSEKESGITISPSESSEPEEDDLPF